LDHHAFEEVVDVAVGEVEREFFGATDFTFVLDEGDTGVVDDDAFDGRAIGGGSAR